MGIIGYPIIEGYTCRSNRKPMYEGGMSVLLLYTNNNAFNKKDGTFGASSSVLVKMMNVSPPELGEEDFEGEMKAYEFMKLLFENEIKLTKICDDPNYFPPFITNNLENQIPYYMIKLEKGQDLESLLSHLKRKNRHIPLPYIKYIASNLCDAILKIQEKGYLHNDLKPANIFVRKNGRVILLDLGISSKAGEEIPFEIQGSIYYSSPELYVLPEFEIPKNVTSVMRGDLEKSKGKKILTAKSDSYPIGMIMYELATLVNRAREAKKLFNLEEKMGEFLKEKEFEERAKKINEMLFGLKTTGKYNSFELIAPLSEYRPKEKGLDRLEGIIRSLIHPDLKKRPSVEELREALEDLDGDAREDDIKKFFLPFMHKMPIG